VFSRFAFSWSF